MSSRKFKLNDSTAQICILSINQANHKFLISVYLTVKPVMVFILCLYVRATVLLAASYANIRHIVAHTHKRNFMFCRIQPRNDINDGKRPNDWHSSAKLNMLGGVFGAPDDCQTNGIRTKFIMRVLLCVCVCVCDEINLAKFVRCKLQKHGFVPFKELAVRKQHGRTKIKIISFGQHELCRCFICDRAEFTPSSALKFIYGIMVS